MAIRLLKHNETKQPIHTEIVSQITLQNVISFFLSFFLAVTHFLLSVAVAAGAGVVVLAVGVEATGSSFLPPIPDDIYC